MNIATDIVLPIVLALIMFALGLGLTVADFVRVLTRPRDFLVGALCQIVLLPLAAFALVSIWPLAPELALGVMILAAAPGGITSNIITAFARGDVALSISLTAVTSLLGIVTIPAIVVFAHAHLMKGDAGEVSVTGAAVGVFLVVTLPMLAGLLVRRFAHGFAARSEPWAKRISGGLFVLVVAGAVLAEHDNIVSYATQAGPVMLVLNVAMMLLAWHVARLASGLRQRISISIECGLQNGTLAIAVSALLFEGTAAAIPATTYSLLMFATGLVFAVAMRQRVGRDGDPA